MQLAGQASLSFANQTPIYTALEVHQNKAIVTVIYIHHSLI